MKVSSIEPDRDEVIQVCDYDGVPHGFNAAQDLHAMMRQIKEGLRDEYKVTAARITYSVFARKEPSL